MSFEFSLLFVDFDGVMTDNKVYVDELGKEAVSCSRKDGVGIHLLKKAGVKVVVLSTEKNEVVKMRSTKLGIDCYYGVQNKKVKAQQILSNLGYKWTDTAFVGDEVNDIELLSTVRYSFCPSDANVHVKKSCKITLKCKGGEGVLREIAEMRTSSIKW
jgi:YrbI family 3-deoxy-D-manno-octulosonate 8-phosphate phosphatase